MAEMVFDFGNALGKWFLPRRNEYGSFIHAIARLSENEWNEVVGRGKPPEGLVRVNGIGYAIGNKARRHTIQERPRGAARYHDHYYGVATAYALSEAFKRSDSSVSLLASHAPVDIKYARNLVAAAGKLWQVECRYGSLVFQINDIMTFDEPLGGFSHYTFTEKGEERTKNPLANKTVLVIDAGGYTVDVVAVDPGGEIDIMSANSTRTGVINLTKNFESEMRSNNATLFQDTGDIDIRRIENAILSGVYNFGRVKIDVHKEAQAAIHNLVADVGEVIRAAGGAANFDVMLMTGGGSALIYDTLVETYPRVEFIMAEKNRDLMKYANVFGGAKISAMLRRMGAR
jgi:actin family MreB-like protein